MLFDSINGTRHLLEYSEYTKLLEAPAGDKDVAFRDATKAALLLEPTKRQPEGRAKLSKALFRKGSAQAQAGVLQGHPW